MAEVAGMGLVPSIARFAEEHPTVRVEIQQTTIPRPAGAETFDIVLAFRGHTEREALGPSSYVGAAVCQLFAAPSYLEKHGAPQSLGDLVRHTLVSPSVSALETTDAVKLLRSAGSSHGVACGSDLFAMHTSLD
jgi:DNA-binding transcriptional LysR family regulator